jgi:general secretion pathway protein N
VRQSGPAALTSRIHWNFQPLALFTGRLQIDLQARGDLALQGQVAVGYRSIRFGNMQAELPATLIQAFYTPAALLSPTGTLRVSAAELELGGSGLAGEGKLVWLGAGGKFGGIGEVGDYRLVVNGRGPTAELRIDTLRGDIAVTAQGEWQAQGEGLLRLTGNITPGSREQTLRPLLAMLNAQNNNGQYSWSLNSRFSPAKFFGATP